MAVSENLRNVRQGIRDALRSAGRAPDATRLLAVSKSFPPSAIREAAAAGQVVFGENRAQELLAKAADPEIPGTVEWHFIGHLQKNKIRKLLPLCSTLHSIDSLDLARQIDRVAAEEGVFPEVYLEVNVAGDSAKFGFTPEGIRADLEALLSLGRIGVAGLMTIPPLAPVPEASRPHFAALRELRDELETRGGVPLPGLSMGMSGDYEVAIAEGSTIVRLGTQVFGRRSTNHT
ncbi:YggS family pyridoxal phosphate-dependent enzyme [soil metagenome]